MQVNSEISVLNAQLFVLDIFCIVIIALFFLLMSEMTNSDAKF